MAISRPSTEAQRISILALASERRLLQDAKAREPFDHFRRGHGGAVSL